MSLARLFQLTPVQARVAIGSLRTVIEAGGPVDEREASFLSTCVDTLELDDDWSTYAAIPPARAAELFSTPDAGRALVFALIIAACIDTQPSAGSVAAVRSFATTLAVETRWVDVLGHASQRRVLPIKLALTRSSPDARRLFARIWTEEGVLGMLRVIRFVLGGGLVEPSLAWRFRQLGLLPAGTLGRTFWTSMTERELAFPGERGGLPIQMIHHDLMHVVNDYPPDAGGECQVAGFYAGFSEGEPFTFVMTALTTFHLGLPVSPPLVTPTIGAFDPAKVIAAFERGRRLEVDIMGDWDYWALMPLSIAEVRERLGIADAIESPAIAV